MKVQVINKSNNLLPKYAHETGDSGVDLRADLRKVDKKFLFNSDVYENTDNGILVIHPGGRALIPTNLYTAIPEGYEIQIRSRSGLALKSGIFCLNSPGTIDANYRNSWGIILANFSNEDFAINHGDRIAQAVLMKVEKIEWEEVEKHDSTNRGLSGFGDSGLK